MTRSTSVYDRFNRTELYQTCIRAGILVRPNEATECMIAYLEGWKEPPPYTEEDHVLHGWRNAFIAFFHEHWKKIETQITCPARHLKDKVTPNPRPCFGCTDMQVIACIIDLHGNEPFVQKHRLIRKTRTP